MKRLLILFLIILMSAPHLQAEIKDIQPPQMNEQVTEQLNKPLIPQEKLKTSSWIWIGVIIIITGVFGSMAYSTKQPI